MQARLLRPGAGEVSRLGQRDPACAIERAALRMNSLIEDLLEVTQAEAGQLSSQPGALPAAQVLADAVEAQMALAVAASIELRLDLPSDVPAIWADRHRALQVFENLIGNALKFTKPNGVITVGAKPDKRAVLFWVSDTGSGIARDELPHLFDRFWQGRRARGGAGLGLPIVKAIVEGHGGRIWVESMPGQGSTFFFTLPRAQPELGAAAEPAAQGR
jgi:signal transduction histidine kinase